MPRRMSFSPLYFGFVKRLNASTSSKSYFSTMMSWMNRRPSKLKQSKFVPGDSHFIAFAISCEGTDRLPNTMRENTRPSCHTLLDNEEAVVNFISGARRYAAPRSVEMVKAQGSWTEPSPEMREVLKSRTTARLSGPRRYTLLSTKSPWMMPRSSMYVMARSKSIMMGKPCSSRTRGLPSPGTLSRIILSRVSDPGASFNEKTLPSISKISKMVGTHPVELNNLVIRTSRCVYTSLASLAEKETWKVGSRFKLARPE
mmetsp:Transcript_47387/g.133308  ORF Transcript_47387/g.133308 Transcript_47387/m.133308 type:complete len:257 (+) Transcript_47387:272-1042(+)